MTTKKFRIGGIEHNAFDINADDTYLYLAVLNIGDIPQILKLKSDLTEEATVVLSTEDGTAANVAAGDYAADYIWASGDFGEAYKVLLSTSAGVYWATVNDWTDANVAAPVYVGPGDDLKVTTATGTAFKQTDVIGTSIYWVTGDAILPLTVNAIDRLDEAYNNCFLGCEYDLGEYNRVVYSPNNGAYWMNLTPGFPSVTVSTLIAGYYDDDD